MKNGYKKENVTYQFAVHMSVNSGLTAFQESQIVPTIYELTRKFTTFSRHSPWANPYCQYFNGYVGPYKHSDTSTNTEFSES